MPVYDYICENDNCEYEWDDLVDAANPAPTTCPECGEETVRKVMSLCAPGRVELGRLEKRDKIKQDTAKLIQEASRNENLCANLVGESKFEENLALEKKVNEVRPKIKKSRKSK